MLTALQSLSRGSVELKRHQNADHFVADVVAEDELSVAANLETFLRQFQLRKELRMLTKELRILRKELRMLTKELRMLTKELRMLTKELRMLRRS